MPRRRWTLLCLLRSCPPARRCHAAAVHFTALPTRSATKLCPCATPPCTPVALLGITHCIAMLSRCVATLRPCRALLSFALALHCRPLAMRPSAVRCRYRAMQCHATAQRCHSLPLRRGTGQYQCITLHRNAIALRSVPCRYSVSWSTFPSSSVTRQTKRPLPLLRH